MGSRGSKIGIRDLRQNASVHVGRVAESGETLEITDRGRPVALLGPLPDASSPLRRLLASGRARAATGDLLDLGPPRGKASTRLSEALKRERDERL